jgi:hypothetical protein
MKVSNQLEYRVPPVTVHLSGCCEAEPTFNGNGYLIKPPIF